MGNLFITELTIPLVEIRLVTFLDAVVQLADYQINKLKSLLQKTRRLFVWKGVRKNTPLSYKINCYVKKRNVLDLNRHRSNCNSVRFLVNGQLQN